MNEEPLGRIQMPLRFRSSLGSSKNYQEQVATSSKAQQLPIQHPLPRKTREEVFPKDLVHKLRKDRWGWVAIAVGKLLNHQEQITSSSKAQCFAKRGKNCHMCKACRNIHIVSPHCPSQVLKLPRVWRHSVLPFSILSEE